MRQPTIYGTALLAGIEFDVLSRLEVVTVDDSFSHEFGVQRCSHDEVSEISPVELDDPLDVLWYVVDEMDARGVTHHNRRYKKRCRQWIRKIIRQLAALDAESFWPYPSPNEAVARSR